MEDWQPASSSYLCKLAGTSVTPSSIQYVRPGVQSQEQAHMPVYYFRAISLRKYQVHVHIGPKVTNVPGNKLVNSISSASSPLYVLLYTSVITLTYTVDEVQSHQHDNRQQHWYWSNVLTVL